VAHDELDVLGADMGGGHGLVHRRGGGAFPEELDEEDEPFRFALDGAAARRED